jgi:hypothetical protein
MKAPRTKANREPGAYRKREKEERDDDRRLRPGRRRHRQRHL